MLAPHPLRVLVTGARGFVGRHLVDALEARGHIVLQADRTPSEGALAIDVTDPLAVRAALDLARPNAIAHLAAQAFVPTSVEDPAGTFSVNAVGTLNMLEALRGLQDSGPPARLLVVSSAEVYGAEPGDALPLLESSSPRPLNPYAASKIAAEALALAYARTYGLDVVVTRAFNHIGAGQDERFAVANFAAQLARVAADEAAVVMVGNLDVSRDFLDVRDVCAAYVRLLEGHGAPGEIYNVASGRATTLKEILRLLIQIAGVPVQVREDPERIRPSDIPLSIGDATKLRDATGWVPAISLTNALRDVYDDARRRLGVAP